MKLIKKSILLLALAGGTFLSGGKAYAQQTLVDVRVDSAAILIGEQTVLHLTVTADKDKAVQLVIPRDTLMAGVEVLEIPKADSTLIENDRLLIEQDLLVTSFDSSLYLLPPFMVIDGADTVYSNQVALKVSTVPVNADKPEERLEAAFCIGRLLSLDIRCVADSVPDLCGCLCDQTYA